MRLYKNTILASLLFCSSALMSQVATPAFAKYLIEQGEYQEVLNLKLFDFHLPSTLQQDSMNFYNAWANFHLQNISKAIQSFDLVSSKSVFYKQSRLFSSWSLLYSGEPELSMERILDHGEFLLDESEVFRLQQSAIYLYQSNLDKATECLKMIERDSTVYADQLNTLNQLLQNRSEFRQKSPAVAATLSAIIPGAGKIYAQEKGAGISSFLILAALGGTAAENIVKSGLTSWNSILFTSIFTAFYLGNIYGSAISVRTYRERYNDNYKQAVLATVIIPLRDYYR